MRTRLPLPVVFFAALRAIASNTRKLDYTLSFLGVGMAVSHSSIETNGQILNFTFTFLYREKSAMQNYSQENSKRCRRKDRPQACGTS